MEVSKRFLMNDSSILGSEDEYFCDDSGKEDFLSSWGSSRLVAASPRSSSVPRFAA